MHNITSPDNSDASIERLIQAKGKTAPRITPKDLEDSILSEHYFTASEGANAKLRPVDAGKPYSMVSEVSLKLLTICVLVLKNGFTIVGKSACASEANFDEEIGRRIAREDAVQQLWPLMGYKLKCDLMEPTVEQR